MISYQEEYGKVYSYKYRHKIYDNTKTPSNLNLNQITQFNNQQKMSQTNPNFYKNENIGDFYRSRAVFSAYLKQRYRKRSELTDSEQNIQKNNKF